jgi:RNA polymerase sigma factor (sigma-70 family)
MRGGQIKHSRKEVEDFLKAYEPMVKRTVSVRMYGLADNVSADDLKQAGRIAVWDALDKFDGRGQIGAYVLQQIKFALAEHLRTNHPAGRYGRKIVFVSDDEAMESIASDDDPAAELQRKQEFEKRVGAMSEKDRESLEKALAGNLRHASVKRFEKLLSGRGP